MIITQAASGLAWVLSATQSADLLFSTTLLDSCTLTAGTVGLLASDAPRQILASNLAGGVAADALVVTTGPGFKVSVADPTGFVLSPPGGADNALFTAEMNATGATIGVGVLSGDDLVLGVGATMLSVDAQAFKSSGTFPSGVYSMAATVECSATGPDV